MRGNCAIPSRLKRVCSREKRRKHRSEMSRRQERTARAPNRFVEQRAARGGEAVDGGLDVCAREAALIGMHTPTACASAL
jgi:hypothetical protein